MVTLFNESLDIGSLITATTQNVTGDLSLTLLMIVVFFVMIAMLFREPMMLVMLLLIPLLVIFSVYEGFGGIFYTILTIVVIALAWQFAKVLIGWGR